MKTKKSNSMEISRSSIHQFLYDTMNETLNEGLPYDEDAEKQFTKSEFNDILSDFRLYGNLFGLLFITKIIEKIDNMAIANYKEEEK